MLSCNLEEPQGHDDSISQVSIYILESIIRVNMGSPIFKGLKLKGPTGRPLGSSVFAWARS